MDTDRVRPEYLPPIAPRRFSFPWMAFWAAALLALAGAGVWLHLKTSAAWTQRFDRTAAERFESMPTLARPHVHDQPADRTLTESAALEEIRLMRASAEREIQRSRQEDKDATRCISGTVFRRIPGGWENVPGLQC